MYVYILQVESLLKLMCHLFSALWAQSGTWSKSVYKYTHINAY